MPVLDWEKTITCPYNIAHQITEGRLQVNIFLSNSSPSPLQSKSNGLEVDFVFPLSQEQEQEQQEQQQQEPPPKSITSSHTRRLRFGMLT